MAVIKHEAFFRKHSIFTGEDLAAHLASRGNVGERGQEALLAYYTKTGRIIRVRGGLYAVVPPGSDPASYPVDPFLIASRLTKDAVMSHHTALEFHGRAYSAWRNLVYLSSRPVRLFIFRSSVFRGVKFPEALIRSATERFDVLTRERSGLILSVTSLERTLVDVLDRPDLSGGWEEIWRSLESVEFFDLDKVVEYALLLGNATTIAKTGFFLDQHREVFSVEEYHLKTLRNHKPRQPHYLDRSKRKNGCLVADWNLVVPRDILERSWGEVL
ncbi:MAG: transcriptional regulator [Candidatus Dadabacteria bacterium]|nr:transcriptional regulator [Candidatus Dadabacteria bacterium]